MSANGACTRCSKQACDRSWSKGKGRVDLAMFCQNAFSYQHDSRTLIAAGANACMVKCSMYVTLPGRLGQQHWPNITHTGFTWLAPVQADQFRAQHSCRWEITQAVVQRVRSALRSCKRQRMLRLALFERCMRFNELPR